MAVKSTVFGGVRLSGSGAKKFQDQVRYGRPKQAASASAERGSQLRAEMNAHGHAVVRARKIR